MPYEITLQDLPIGYAAESVQAGQRLQVVTSGFTSCDCGSQFIRMLEGGLDSFLAALPPDVRVSRSQVDHLLAVVRRDRSATIYLNELVFLSRVRIKSAMSEGATVRIDDVADITDLGIEGIDFPSDIGFMLFLSCGWRRGLIFDYAPLHPERFGNRTLDVEQWLGRCYAQLQFQHLFSLTDEDWQRLLSQDWFPFISLRNSTIREVLNYAQHDWRIDELLPRVREEIVADASAIRERWRGRAAFTGHVLLLQRALDHFINEDYLSAVAILYPRIEGILRDHHRMARPALRPTQGNLVDSVISSSRDPNPVLILPERFAGYLRNIYFAAFDPTNPTVVSRHSVAHGVAPIQLFNLKAAVISLLIVEQLNYYVRDP